MISWSYHTKQKHKKCCFHIEKVLQKSDICLTLQNVLFAEYKAEWNNKVISNSSIFRNNGGNKLRTYKLSKSVYETEQYTIPCQVQEEAL